MGNESRLCNISRDEDCLVVPIDNPVFPNRCIKSNEPVEDAGFRFVADLVARTRRNIQGWSGKPDETTGASYRRLEIHVGLESHIQATAARRRRRGLLLVVVGPLTSVALGTLLALTTTRDQVNWAPAALALLLGMLIMIAGVIVFAMSSSGTLRVVGWNGSHAWLHGAAPEFLAELPESPVLWPDRQAVRRQ